MAPKIVHSEEGLGVGLLVTVPNPQIGDVRRLGVFLFEGFERRGVVEAEGQKPQSQFGQAGLDLGQGEAVLHIMEDHVPAGADAEEIAAPREP